MERKEVAEAWDEEVYRNPYEGNMSWETRGFWFLCGMTVTVVFFVILGFMLP